MIETIEVEITRAELDAEWARNNPGPVELFKPQIGSRSVATLAREKGVVSKEYVVDRVEFDHDRGCRVFFKLPPVRVPEQDLSIEGLF